MSLARAVRGEPGRSYRGVRRTFPACSGGWNTRDPLEDMKPRYATELVNMLPLHGSTRVRDGFRRHALTGEAGEVRGLVSFSSGAVEKLFAAVGTKIFDVTPVTGDALIEMPAEVATGLVSSRVNSAALGGYGFIVGAGNAPLRITPAGDVEPHEWTEPTGVLDFTDLFYVVVWKGRAYFLERDSAVLWYGPPKGVEGDLSPFDLGQIAPRGGHLVGLASISHDAGEGPEDLFVALFSRGTALVYSGSGIGEGGDFSLVGRWELGRVLGERAVDQFGNDAVVATVEGVKVLRGYLANERRGDADALSKLIAEGFSAQVDAVGDLSGWEVVFHPEAQWLIVSNPGGTQHVMNTVTGAWATFRGMAAHAWERFGTRLFWGGADGVVYEANVAGAGDDGSPIAFSAQTAYRNFTRENAVQVKMLRPIVRQSGTVRLRAGVSSDFELPYESVEVDSEQSEGERWGAAGWDTFRWEGGARLIDEWMLVDADTGSSIAARIEGEAFGGGRVEWFSTGVMFVPLQGV